MLNDERRLHVEEGRIASNGILVEGVACTKGEALGFGLVLAVGSVVFLGIVSNWFAAAFLAFTIFFYAVIYTMWLKRWQASPTVGV